MKHSTPPGHLDNSRLGPRRTLTRLLIGALAACALVQAQDSYDTVYNDIGSLPCVRLLNATGSIGCQSMDAASGVLYRTDSQDEIQKFASDQDLSSTYTVLMPYWLLTEPNIQMLKASKKLGAIVAIVNGTDTPYTQASRPATITSPDTTCPNCEFGLYASSSDQYQWNPTGTGQIFHQHDFPIYALNTMDERNTMSYNAVMQAANMNRFKGYNAYPLKALQFHSFMWAAQDSETCLRRGWCTPVGGASVWSTPSYEITSIDGKPIIIVSAAMDARSLFHDITLGVESSVTGMVTLFAVAEALSRSTIPLNTMKKHILYTLFTAEAWGSSGSQRFVQDISKKLECLKQPASGSGCAFPFYSNLDFQRINPSNIEAVLEVSQVGALGAASGSTPSLYAHVDKSPSPGSAALVQQLIQVGGLANNASVPAATSRVLAASSDNVERGLPPSSAMSFLKAKANIATVVLTGYQKEMNPRTSSDLDDTWDPVSTVKSIQDAASVLAKTAWLQAQGVQDSTAMSAEQQQAIGSIEVDPTVIQDLLVCLTRNYSCPLVDRYLNVTASGSPPTRLPHYTGTLYSQSQPFPIFAWSFLANMTRAKNGSARVTGCSSNAGKVQCGANEYCVGDQCLVTMTRYHDAFGVGIAMDESNSYYVKDASKPTWTESTWDPIGLRLFEVNSPSSQIVELATGIVLTVVSIGAVWYSKRYLQKTLKVA